MNTEVSKKSDKTFTERLLDSKMFENFIAGVSALATVGVFWVLYAVGVLEWLFITLLNVLEWLVGSLANLWEWIKSWDD